MKRGERDYVVIEDWYLQKSLQPASVWCHDQGTTGGYISDFEERQTSYRVVGTDKQIREWADKQTFILDEVYGYDPIEKDSYWDGICCKDDDPDDNRNLPTREEYNIKWKKDLEKYTKMYEENDKKILILRTG